MNSFFISSVLTAASSFGFGALVLFRSSNARLARKWFVFVNSVAIWGAGAAWIAIEKDPHISLLLWRIVFAIGGTWISPLFYDFVCDFLGRASRRSVRINYWIGMCYCLVIPTTPFFPYTRWMFDQINYARGGWIFYSYSLWWWGLIVYSHFLLARAQKSGTPEKRNQIRYFLLATAVGFSGGVINFLGLFGLNVYPWGQCAIPLYPLIMSYAILKHQLMDVRVVIQKTLVYSVATLSLTAIYVALLIIFSKVLQGWVGAPSMYSSAIAAIIIAVIFHPMRIRIQSWLDRRFPRESLNQHILREATGRFVHEIKRPLANISMPAQLAVMDLETAAKSPADFTRLLPKLRERLNYIVNESLKAGQKIEAIRNVSSQTSIPQNRVDFGKLVLDVLALEEVRLAQAEIALTVIGVSPGQYMQGDGAQLEIALANVLKNAIDALIRLSPEQPRRLRVSLCRDLERLTLEIEDSGPGISAADLPHLFDPWFTTKGSGGMGIGLYLTREIMRLHNAYIDVKSRPGTTLFRLTFQFLSA